MSARQHLIDLTIIGVSLGLALLLVQYERQVFAFLRMLLRIGRKARR